MRSRSKCPAKPNQERGSVLVVVAASMVVMMGFAALAVDLGYLYVAGNQLQNVADASSLAATRTLGHIYQGLTPEEQVDFECLAACQTAVRQAAYDVAAENSAAGVAMTLREADVVIGRWDGDAFTATLEQPDAVEVIARRDSEVNGNGPVTTFFARVLGIDETDVNAIATAAMTGQGTTAEGEVELPVGISEEFFEGGPEEFCKENIVLHPTSDDNSCAGWTVWNYKENGNSSPTPIMRSILTEEDGFDAPVTIANSTTFQFGGGTQANLFSELLVLYQKHGYATDITPEREYIDHNGQRMDWEDAIDFSPYPLMEEDGVTQQHYPDWDKYKSGAGAPRYYHKWETTVPVFRLPCGVNPGGDLLIVGFAPIEIIDVLETPEKTIVGKVMCDLVSPEDNRGGGGSFGIKGPIPGLVR